LHPEEEKKSKKKIWQWLGLLLIGCGLVLLGYTVYEKARAAYYQQQLQRAYEETFYKIVFGKIKIHSSAA